MNQNILLRMRAWAHELRFGRGSGPRIERTQATEQRNRGPRDRLATFPAASFAGTYNWFSQSGEFE
jgi:hypothetical protein